MIDELRKQNEILVLVDGGDMFFNSKTVPELRAETILEGMNYMAYNAVTFGEGELEMGMAFLDKTLKQFPIPLVSANIRMDGLTAPVQPYIIEQFQDIRIGITAITPKVMIRSDVIRNKGLIVDEPVSALKRVLAEMKGKADLIILLSHMGFDGTKNLLKFNDMPEVSVAVAGHGRHLTDQPEKVGQTLIVQNSMGGEMLSVLRLMMDTGKQITTHELENIALTDEVPVDGYMHGKIDEFKMKESRSRSTEKELEQMEKVEKERKEILQLSPEAFIRRMTLQKQ